MKRGALKQRQSILPAVLALWGTLSGGVEAAQQPAPSSRAAASAIKSTSVLLDYQEVPYDVVKVSLTVTDRTNPFHKEPPINEGKVRRGQFDFGVPNNAPLPFLWDQARRRLYLDLNRNEDLTDDPEGVFTSRDQVIGLSSFHQGTFTNVHLKFDTPDGWQPWRVHLELTDFRGHFSAMAAQHSLWTGMVTLEGRVWQAGWLGHPQVKSRLANDGHLLLRPWEAREEAFDVSDGSLVAFPLPKMLFLQTHLYQVECATVAEGGKWRCRLTFQERPAELGEVRVNGDLIQRLHLTGGPGLAVLLAPASTVRVPVGNYGNPLVRIGKGGVAAHPKRADAKFSQPLIVTKTLPVTVTVGGPLTNSVTVKRRGRNLVFNYELLGAGGEAYELTGSSRAEEPGFTVHQGDQQIASGKFNFG